MSFTTWGDTARGGHSVIRIPRSNERLTADMLLHGSHKTPGATRPCRLPAGGPVWTQRCRAWGQAGVTARP